MGCAAIVGNMRIFILYWWSFVPLLAEQ
jgi:hypothetical protein